MINHAARSPRSILVGLFAVGLFGACTSTKSGGQPSVSGTAGAATTGGNSASGGRISTGGVSATGGNTAGGSSSAGVTSAGGASVVGGNSGASSAAGGVSTAGGTTVAGTTFAGGSLANGGSRATGETTPSGGVTAAGGSASFTGGTTGGNPDAGLIDVRSRDASGGRSDLVAGDAPSGAVEVARDASTAKGDAAAVVSFKTQILPLLKANCVNCHGPTQQSMGVRVDTYANVSAHLQDVTDVLVNGGMPPAGPLPDEDRQLFQTWVDQGALNN